MNKLIVVSGATKGIGFEILKIFIKNDFDAIICSRNEKDLKKLENDFSKISKNKILSFSADLSKKTDCNRFIDFIKNTNRNIDVLVNNTGFYIPGQISDEPDGQLEAMIHTNLFSAYHLTRGILPNMIANKLGHIFNICSIASIIPYPNGGSYSISKYAMYGMTKVLREEMKPHNIRVTAILPGATRTASWDGFADSLDENRLMDPADVAIMVFASYSLSPKSVVEDIIIRPQLGDL